MAIVWSKDQPAVVYARKLIFQYFPAVALHWEVHRSVSPSKGKDGKEVWQYFKNHPKHGVGGFNARQTKAGKVSTHSEGRSADIYVDVHNAYLKRFGDELFTRIAQNAAALGVEQVIWNQRIWTDKKPTIRTFDPHKAKLEDHKDHLHLQFSRAASQQTPAALETLVKDAAAATDAAF